MIATGGKTVYGAALGILMLETRFPRTRGDIGHAGTWPFPVLYGVVRGATPSKAVRHDPMELAAPFIEEGRRLVAMGADGIATNCGFLSLLQSEMSEALGVPVAASSLMQASLVAATLPAGRRVGVLTISKQTLTPAHLAAAGVPEGSPVEGTDGGEFSEAILNDRERMDLGRSREDLLAGTERLMAHGGIGAIVLECTNMVPWAADIRAAAGVPVYSIETFLRWFQSGLEPRRF